MNRLVMPHNKIECVIEKRKQYEYEKFSNELAVAVKGIAIGFDNAQARETFFMTSRPNKKRNQVDEDE